MTSNTLNIGDKKNFYQHFMDEELGSANVDEQEGGREGGSTYVDNCLN